MHALLFLNESCSEIWYSLKECIFLTKYPTLLHPGDHLWLVTENEGKAVLSGSFFTVMHRRTNSTITGDWYGIFGDPQSCTRFDCQKEQINFNTILFDILQTEKDFSIDDCKAENRVKYITEKQNRKLQELSASYKRLDTKIADVA